MATSANANDYDFMKYRGPTYGSGPYENNTNTNNSTGNNSNSYCPSYEDYPNFGAGIEQPSSWLHGSDFNSMAGDLFSSNKAAAVNDPSFGNLSLNLDQIKIVNLTLM